MAGRHPGSSLHQPDLLVGIARRAAGRVDAAASLSPYRQGEFDGFCGLYTIVNALRLALHPVRPLAYADAKTLFRTGIRFLERRDMLASAGFGMPLPSWQALADDVVAAASEMVAVPITIERPFHRHDVGWPTLLDGIRQLIDEDRAVMLVLRGAYRHHSIVTARALFWQVEVTCWHRRWIPCVSVG